MVKAGSRASIVGTGKFLPEKVLTNFDLEKMVDTSDEWIRSRTGISERRIADAHMASSDLAYPAAQEALREANLSPDDLDLIIVASATPDMPFPSTACHLQANLGARRAGAFDLSAACTGFIYALASAAGFIASGTVKTVLVVGSECLSRFVDWTDRNTCVLFGDGAGAAVLQPSHGRREILHTFLAADGTGKDLICIPAGGSRLPPTAETLAQGQHTMKLRGREVFKFAVTAFQTLIRDALQECGLREQDVALVVPHQVNTRIIDAALKDIHIPMDKVFVNIDRYGNTSAASIPIALHEAVQQGRLKEGDVILLVAFGGGLTWGSVVLRW
ncbi:MAG: ketoacyl-ACP synthase III [Planctomycetes bacterium]|nr:ketoacyl-ACP synthase III [Planctomycetota bacterium]